MARTQFLCCLCLIIVVFKEAEKARADIVDQDVLKYHAITYDTANVTVHNDLDREVSFYLQSSECYKCKLIFIQKLKPYSEGTFHIDTAWSVFYGMSDSTEELLTPTDPSIFCNSSQHFGENGNYTIAVQYTENSTVNCDAKNVISPDNAYIPIFISMGIFLIMTVTYCVYYQLERSGMLQRLYSCFSTDRLINDDLGMPPEPLRISDRASINNQTRAKTRVKSLDTFRGIAIVIMIFVNYGGGRYWFFAHSTWNGLTVADLAFPWFVFIMGASIKLSQAVLYRRDVSKWKIFGKIAKRSLILFALGCLLDGGIDLKYYRIPGVLQRFAVGYSVVATIQLASLKPRNDFRLQKRIYRLFSDILDYWYEWLFAIGLLLVYLLLTFLWLPPGCMTKGYLGPGGPLVEGNHTNCTGGAQGAIDRLVFSPNHIYQTPTCKVVYRTTQPYDPEGILGCITTILMTFLGLQASKILHVYQSHTSRLIRFLIWGVLLGSIGIILSGAKRDDGFFPINKNLWSPSYVTATAGLAFILLAFCYVVIDVQGWWSGAPFFYADWLEN